MGAFVIDGVHCILHLKQRHKSAASLHHLAVMAGNFFQRCDLNAFLCHPSLLKKHAWTTSQSPHPQSRADHRLQLSRASDVLQGCGAATASKQNMAMILLQ
jgi:hypothetical protein